MCKKCRRPAATHTFYTTPILEELRTLRRHAPQCSPLKLLYSGFGLAQGLVIEGNMGAQSKTDYTIIGDAVNIASRLEGLTRQTKSLIVMSELLKDSTKEPWVFVSLGKYNLKGKEKDSEIYSIDNDLVNEFPESIFVE